MNWTHGLSGEGDKPTPQPIDSNTLVIFFLILSLCYLYMFSVMMCK